MFTNTNSVNNNTFSSAPLAANPTTNSSSDSSAAETALFHTLFAMSAPINTINQDFCLYDPADESAFDYPLFNPAGAVNKKAACLSAAAAAAFVSNPLCTPQTPSLDLVSAPAANQAYGFDALFDDSILTPQLSLLNTPYTPYIDTPAIIDAAALETPFLDFGLDSTLDTKLAAASNAAGFSSLFPEFAFDVSFDQVYSIAPNMIMPLNQQNVFKAGANDFSLPSPIMSDTLSAPTSPVKAIPLNLDIASDDEDEVEFVSSRSAALVSGLKRKASSPAISPVKKAMGITASASVSKTAAPKRFSCSHAGCDRRFARLFNLHTHEKTHDPEQARPFLCSDAECGKAFSRKHDLQRHEASVHKGERNFACTKCLKPFSRQDGLRRHLAVKGSCSDHGGMAT